MRLTLSQALYYWNEETSAVLLVEALIKTFSRFSQIPPGVSDRQEDLGHLILEKMLPMTEVLQQYKKIKKTCLKSAEAKDADIIKMGRHYKGTSIFDKGGKN